LRSICTDNFKRDPPSRRGTKAALPVLWLLPQPIPFFFMQPISIALCTCNGERYLDEQLRTLRVQDGVTEIVVVDDVSSDATWSILERHAAADGRLRLHRNSARLGVTKNFEGAIRLVTNPWVALADQDDVWLPEKLARLRAAWDGCSGLVHHATHKFSGATPAVLPSPAGESRKFSGSDLRFLLHRNSIVGHTVVMRTGLARWLMPFPRRLPHDWWLGVGAALRDRVQYVDEYLVHYRIHADNAYHAAGSRRQRIADEQRLRLELLRILPGWLEPSSPMKPFIETYRKLLENVAAGASPWALLRFYFQHAAVLFGGGHPLPIGRRVRKSLTASLGAVLGKAGSGAGKVLRPVPPIRTATAPDVRQVG
jgi:glycosyltransferase involved in cell wall biosynthesis